MLSNSRLRLVVSALAIALLGSACDLAAASASDDCQVTLDYKISCPGGDADLGLKTN